MTMLMVERPQPLKPEDEKVELQRNTQGLLRLPVLLFGKLPEGYEEDPMDPAGTAD